MSKSRTRANIQVGANWEAFKEKCKKQGSSASREINNFINAYMADTETIASNSHPGWIDDKTRRVVREEMPPTLKAFEDKIDAKLKAQMEIIEAKLSQIKSSDQEAQFPTEPQTHPFNINVNSQNECYTVDSEIDVDQDGSEVGSDVIENESLPKGKNDSQPLDSAEPGKIKKDKNYRQSTQDSVVNNRQLAKILGVHNSSVSRWRRRWDELSTSHLIKRSGFVPDGLRGWRKASITDVLIQ